MTEKDDFLELAKNGDCPALLIDLLGASRGKWRRGIIKEFIADHLWKKATENKLKKLSRENKAIMGMLLTLIGIALKIAFFGA